MRLYYARAAMWLSLRCYNIGITNLISFVAAGPGQVNFVHAGLLICACYKQECYRLQVQQMLIALALIELLKSLATNAYLKR